MLRILKFYEKVIDILNQIQKHIYLTNVLVSLSNSLVFLSKFESSQNNITWYIIYYAVVIYISL